ncbi:hypothetical protein UFOVP28_59 [uncultured Caudovirales phage]|uniref:Large polyvalent protein associated domain-containing protein n=1 Tax=uncultured Caudovirales phage TaxID=2100421 RepID=A0A6J5KRK6_9CAUD|nr:hypothetical protein UFOVP28_59 [uncultured Caudovirales phage]
MPRYVSHPNGGMLSYADDIPQDYLSQIAAEDAAYHQQQMQAAARPSAPVAPPIPAKHNVFSLDTLGGGLQNMVASGAESLGKGMQGSSRFVHKIEGFPDYQIKPTDVSNALVSYGEHHKIKDPNWVEGLTGIVGDIAPAFLSPGAGVATFGGQGYQTAYEKNKALNKENTPGGLANELGSFGLGTAMATIPFGEYGGKLLGKIPGVGKGIADALAPNASGISALIAKPTVGALSDATGFGGLTAGQNLLTKATIDPNQNLMEGVPESMLQGAAFGGLGHGIPEAFKFGKEAYKNSIERKATAENLANAARQKDIVDRYQSGLGMGQVDEFGRPLTIFENPLGPDQQATPPTTAPAAVKGKKGKKALAPKPGDAPPDAPPMDATPPEQGVDPGMAPESFSAPSDMQALVGGDESIPEAGPKVQEASGQPDMPPQEQTPSQASPPPEVGTQEAPQALDPSAHPADMGLTGAAEAPPAELNPAASAPPQGKFELMPDIGAEQAPSQSAPAQGSSMGIDPNDLFSKQRTSPPDHIATEIAGEPVKEGDSFSLKPFYDKLRGEMNRLTGNNTLGLRVFDAIHSALNPDTTIEGSYAPGGDPQRNAGQAMVSLAAKIYDPKMTADQLLSKLSQVMNHEVVHHLRALDLFTPREWNTLAMETAKRKHEGGKTWLDHAIDNYPAMDEKGNVVDPSTLSPEKLREYQEHVTEEAVANMTAAHSARHPKVSNQAEGLMSRALRALSGIVRAIGRSKADKVMDSFQRGEIGKRDPTGESRPMLPSEKYKVVYHGTSRVFDRYRNDRIGEGEGNKTYGWGHYFAGNKKIAGTYKKNLARFGIGNILHQNLNVEHHQMLDWDKPMSEQPKGIKEKVNATIEDLKSTASGAALSRLNKIQERVGRGILTGEKLYKELNSAMMHMPSENYPDLDYLDKEGGGHYKTVSQAMERNGIPALRYYDAASRAEHMPEEKKTHNYVVFDEKYIDPVHKVEHDYGSKLVKRLFEANKNNPEFQKFAKNAYTTGEALGAEPGAMDHVEGQNLPHVFYHSVRPVGSGEAPTIEEFQTDKSGYGGISASMNPDFTNWWSGGKPWKTKYSDPNLHEKIGQSGGYSDGQSMVPFMINSKNVGDFRKPAMLDKALRYFFQREYGDSLGGSSNNKWSANDKQWGLNAEHNIYSRQELVRGGLEDMAKTVEDVFNSSKQKLRGGNEQDVEQLKAQVADTLREMDGVSLDLMSKNKDTRMSAFNNLMRKSGHTEGLGEALEEADPDFIKHTVGDVLAGAKQTLRARLDQAIAQKRFDDRIKALDERYPDQGLNDEEFMLLSRANTEMADYERAGLDFDEAKKKILGNGWLPDTGYKFDPVTPSEWKRYFSMSSEEQNAIYDKYDSFRRAKEQIRNETKIDEANEKVKIAYRGEENAKAMLDESLQTKDVKDKLSYPVKFAVIEGMTVEMVPSKFADKKGKEIDDVIALRGDSEMEWLKNRQEIQFLESHIEQNTDEPPERIARWREKINNIENKNKELLREKGRLSKKLKDLRAEYSDHKNYESDYADLLHEMKSKGSGETGPDSWTHEQMKDANPQMYDDISNGAYSYWEDAQMGNQFIDDMGWDAVHMRESSKPDDPVNIFVRNPDVIVSPFNTVKWDHGPDPSRKTTILTPKGNKTVEYKWAAEKLAGTPSSYTMMGGKKLKPALDLDSEIILRGESMGQLYKKVFGALGQAGENLPLVGSKSTSKLESLKYGISREAWERGAKNWLAATDDQNTALYMLVGDLFRNKSVKNLDINNPALAASMAPGIAQNRVMEFRSGPAKDLETSMASLTNTGPRVEALRKLLPNGGVLDHWLAERNPDGSIKYTKNTKQILTEAYAYAMHALEYNKYGRDVMKKDLGGKIDPAVSGMTDAEANAIIRFKDSLPLDEKNALEKAHADLMRITEDTRIERVRTGLEPDYKQVKRDYIALQAQKKASLASETDPKRIERLTKEIANLQKGIDKIPDYKYYVPLKSAAEDVAYDEGGNPASGRAEFSGGARLTVRGAEDMNRTGRSSYAGEIIPNAHSMFENSVQRGVRNQAGNVLYNMIKDAHDAGDPDIGKYFDKPEKIPYVWKKNDDGTVTSAPAVDHKNEPDAFITKIGGEDHYVKIKDDAMMKALNGFDESDTGTMSTLVRGMNGTVKMINKFMPLAAWNRYYHFINAGASIPFAVRLFFKHTDMAKLNAAGFNDPAIAKLIGKYSYEYAHGLINPLASQASKDAVMQDLESLRKRGGIIQPYAMGGVDNYQRHLNAVMDPTGVGLSKEFLALPPHLRRAKMDELLHSVEKKLIGFTNKVEWTTRLAVDRAFREQGIDPKKAAYMAQDLTGNFSRKGSMTGSLAQLYPFFNAGVQSDKSTIQSMLRMGAVGGTKQVAKFIGKLTAIGFLTGLYNDMMGELHKDSEGNNPYWMMSDYDRNGASALFNIPFTDHYIKYPKPFKLLSIPTNFGSRLYEMAKGHNDPWAVAHATMSEMIGGADHFGGNPSADPLISMIPGAARPFYQMSANSNWNGAPIHPVDTGFPPKPNSQVHMRNTSGFAKGVANTVSSLTGGDQVIRPGGVELYPDNIDFMAKQLGGSAGMVVGGVLGMGDIFMPEHRAAAGKESYSATDLPVVNAILAKAGAKQVNSAYFEESDKAARAVKVVQAANKALEAGDATAAQMLANEQARYPDDFGNIGLYQETESGIKSLKTAIKQIQANPDMAVDQKAKMVSDYENVITGYQRQYISRARNHGYAPQSYEKAQ